MRGKRNKICPNSCSLPREVTLIILSKLPCKAILRCKAVCTEWLNIVTSDPLFAKTHYENNFMTLVCGKAILDGYKKKSNNKRGWFYKLDPYTFHHRVPPRGNLWDEFDVVNSCKGFLLMKQLFWDSKKLQNYVVYNPLTNERVFLPNFQTDDLRDFYGLFDTDCCGLGFSPVMKQFKVVILVYDKWHEDFCGIHIYTLGNGDGDESRTHGDITPGAKRSLTDGDRHILKNGIKNDPIELNGFLHWDTPEDRIVCFDVEKEKLGEMSSPCSGESANHMVNTIGVYKGLLCRRIVKELGNSRQMEIWVMKEYGINESWMRLVVVKEVLANKSIYGCPAKNFKLQHPKLLDILDNGEMIFLATLDRGRYRSYHLFSYDPIKECFEKLWFPNYYSKMRVDIYTPSFFSLNPANFLAS